MADDDALSTVDAAAVARLRNLHGQGRGLERPHLLVKLVDLFQAGSSDALAQLRSALQASDLEAAHAICHKLGSSAANIGALSFAKGVRRLGELCAAGDADRPGLSVTGCGRPIRRSSTSCRAFG